MTSGRLFLRVLGEFELVWGGRPVQLPVAGGARELFAYVALSDDAPAERMLTALFRREGAAPPVIGDTLDALNGTLAPAGVRLSMTAGTVGLTGTRIDSDLGLVEALSTAAANASALEAALRLYRGGFLATLPLPACPGYEDWRSRMAAVAEQRRLTLVRTLAENTWPRVKPRPHPLPDRLRIGRWQVDLATRCASSEDDLRRLSPKAVAVLRVLLEGGEAVVPRGVLLERVWPGVLVVEEALTNAVGELRRTLGEPPKGGGLIETIHKTGYKLVARAVPLPPAPEMSTSADNGASGGDELMAVMLCMEAMRVGNSRGRNGLEEAVRKLAEAERMAPGLPLVHASRSVATGFLWQSRGKGPGPKAALGMAEKALSLGPSDPKAQAAVGFALAMLGQGSAARGAIGKALATSAASFEVYHIAARALFSIGDARAAAVVAERAADMRAEDFQTSLLAARAAEAMGDVALAQVHARTGLFRARRQIVSDPDDALARNAIGPLLALLGHADEAAAAVLADEGRGAPVEYYNAAAMARAGVADAALDRLEHVLDAGWSDPHWIRADAMLAPIRRERRFRQLMRPFG